VINVNEESQERLAILIDDAMSHYDQLSEDEIYESLGASLTSMGLEAETESSSRYFMKPLPGINYKATPYEATLKLAKLQSEDIGTESATEKGKEFWLVFKSKAKEHICGDEGILALIKESKLKEALLLAVPGLLASMGLTAVFIPAVALIISGILMLLLKTGIETYCEI